MTHDSGRVRPTSGVGSTLGDRLADLRRSAGLTQTGLSTRSGVSVDVIRKLEQGQRHTASIPTLQKLAKGLDVDAGQLLSKPRQLASDGADSGAVTIRHTLTAAGDLIGDDPEVEPLTVEDGQRALAYGWGSYWSGRYDQLGQLLPTTIARARATVRTVPAAERAAAADVAAQVLQLAACTLVHLGYTDVAHLALREALDHAAAGTDPLRVQAVRGSVAWVMLVEGRFWESGRLAASSAGTLAPGGKTSLPEWSLYGSLLLSSATAAGRAGDRASGLALIDEAVLAAERTGQRNDYELAFGPDQVAMQRVDVETVTEHYASALDAARLMPPDSALPLAARARHLSDVALAHTRLGHDGDALDVLDTMITLAPAWSTWQEQPRLIYRELQERIANPPRLVELGRRLGVDRA